MDMKNFKKWENKFIEDWGCAMSDDAKSFYRAFKNYLKRAFPNAELIGFKPNHYDTSGFIKMNGKVIYVSHSIDRYKKKVDFNESGAMNGVLYRTAESENDFTGGWNNFTSINNMAKSILELFEKMDMAA